MTTSKPSGANPRSSATATSGSSRPNRTVPSAPKCARQLELGQGGCGHGEPAGPVATEQLGEDEAARPGADQEDVGAGPQRQDVQAVHGTRHRFGQDSGVEVEVVDQVALARRRHHVVGEPARIGHPQRPEMPAVRRAPAPAVVAQAAGEHVVQGDQLTGCELGHAVAQQVHLPDDLVPRDQGVDREELSVMEMYVRAAHSGYADT